MHDQLVQSLSTGLHLLEYIAQKHESLSLASIVRDLKWDKSKTRRLLCTLAHEGFLDYDPTEKTYVVGSKIFSLHQDFLQTLRLKPQFAHKFLEELAENTQELTGMTALRGNKITAIDIALSDPTKLVIRIGASAPLFWFAHGKVFLAQMSPEQVTQLWEDLDEQAYPRTKDELKEILDELEQIRHQGYAIAKGKYPPYRSSIAAPLSNSIQVVASLGIVVPGPSIPEDRIPFLVEQVKIAARDIEDTMVHGAFGKLLPLKERFEGRSKQMAQ